MQNPPAHELHMTTLITPAMANFSGNLHGGELLKMLDQVAYACASRYSGNMCVTLSVDNVIFKEPIHVGELVNYYASVNLVGSRKHPNTHRAPHQFLLFHHGCHERRQARCRATAGIANRAANPTPRRRAATQENAPASQFIGSLKSHHTV